MVESSSCESILFVAKGGPRRGLWGYPARAVVFVGSSQWKAAVMPLCEVYFGGIDVVVGAV